MDPDDEPRRDPEDETLEPYRSPDDRERIWLHPSELGSLLPPAPRAGSPAGEGAGRDEPGPPARHPGPDRRLRSLALPVASGMIGAVLTFGVLVLAGGMERRGGDPVVERVTNVAARDLSGPDGVAQLAAAVAPAIVGLRASTPNGERFGTGVVFRSDGHILTNFHLVDAATAIEVTCADGRSWSARPVGADPDSDLAVLAVSADAVMEPAVLGSARTLRVGQAAIVMGAPAGPQGSPSVTAGVIAGLGEVVEIAGRSFYDMILTDAMIGPRASGGPLVDRTGAVVGITSRTGTDDHLGHVIPIDLARKVAEKLIVTGRVNWSWLGLSGTDLDPSTAREYGVGTGTLIRGVSPASPAEDSGLRVADVVTAFESLPISTMNELTMLVRRHDPGENVSLTVVRAGVRHNVKVRLAGIPGGKRSDAGG